MSQVTEGGPLGTHESGVTSGLPGQCGWQSELVWTLERTVTWVKILGISIPIAGFRPKWVRINKWCCDFEYVKTTRYLFVEVLEGCIGGKSYIWRRPGFGIGTVYVRGWTQCFDEEQKSVGPCSHPAYDNYAPLMVAGVRLPFRQKVPPEAQAKLQT
jgi:hypothetical protein